MRICLYTDNHFCANSSIVRSRGERFSSRLENQILSVNWAENLAKDTNSDVIVCLGDFFDKEYLNSEELTALREIEWYKGAKHYFLVGNHEMGMNDLTYSSVNALPSDFVVVNKNDWFDDGLNTQFCFLPYCLDNNRKTINDVFGKCPCNKRIIFSHNDISGIEYGGYVSKLGYSVDDIESNCDLFLNGHLHNGGWVSNKIFNLGNLTGQNFSEDAQRYEHIAIILDVDENANTHIEYYENPFAYNFYKLDVTDGNFDKLNELKPHSIVTVKCNERDAKSVNDALKDINNIEGSRVLTVSSKDDEGLQSSYEELSVDHLNEFKKFVMENVGTSDEVLQELDEVCK